MCIGFYPPWHSPWLSHALIAQLWLTVFGARCLTWKGHGKAKTPKKNMVQWKVQQTKPLKPSKKSPNLSIIKSKKSCSASCHWFPTWQAPIHAFCPLMLLSPSSTSHWSPKQLQKHEAGYIHTYTWMILKFEDLTTQVPSPRCLDSKNVCSKELTSAPVRRGPSANFHLRWSGVAKKLLGPQNRARVPNMPFDAICFVIH